MTEKGKTREKEEEKGAAPEGRGALFACAYLTVIFAIVIEKYNKYKIIVLLHDKELLWEKH